MEKEDFISSKQLIVTVETPGDGQVYEANRHKCDELSSASSTNMFCLEWKIH
jgi:hypothetical protein